jgi:hypothetical protein
MLSVLILEVTNLLIHLSQLVLHLLNVLVTTFQLLLNSTDLVFSLQESLLLILNFKSCQVDIVLVASNITLQLVVRLIDLHNFVAHVVYMSHLLLLDTFLLTGFVL